MGQSWLGKDSPPPDWEPGEGPAAGCLMAVLTLGVIVLIVAFLVFI